MKIIENYIDESFEKEVLKLIPDKGRNHNFRNNVLRYGYNKPYKDNFVSNTIPECFNVVKEFEFDSVTINEYLKGQKINWHIDSPDGGKIINIISLVNDGVLKFRKNNEEKSFLLPRFSLSIMSDELRYEWEHSLTAEEYRVSVVFKNTKNK